MTDLTELQPIAGSRGATVAGPRKIALEDQVPDIFAAPATDKGSLPNLHSPSPSRINVWRTAVGHVK